MNIIRLFIPMQQSFIEIKDEKEALSIQKKIYEQSNVYSWIIYT